MSRIESKRTFTDIHGAISLSRRQRNVTWEACGWTHPLRTSTMTRAKYVSSTRLLQMAYDVSSSMPHNTDLPMGCSNARRWLRLDRPSNGDCNVRSDVSAVGFGSRARAGWHDCLGAADAGVVERVEFR